MIIEAYGKGMLISVCMIMEDCMGQNILVGVFCVVALAAGIWGWLIDRGYSFGKDEDKKLESEEKVDEEN